ncbi:enoyl-CoA hydratase [Microvirga sp. W0021]|uniref:Enoyl-CoA hydratase domain-containing protein 3, mitochondrial n=1 Tax=Hohaiivirga grylli TaxID=3133970 RepID=A0ABV0BKH4_9HYPH
MDMHSPTEILQTVRKDQVLLVRLNNPKARNALSEEMIELITSVLEETAQSKDIRAVILAASGPAFCAGHDLKGLTSHRQDDDQGHNYFSYLLTLCSDMMQRIVELPQPVIAAVEGIASAAGCQLVASCDLAVASHSSRFCTPGVNIGVFCSTPMVALSRNLSRKHAMEMLTLGEMFSAEDAHRFGLINRVVPDGQAEAEALNLAQIIADKSHVALKIGKKAFYEQLEKPQREAYRYVVEVMAENMMHQHAEEGINAFIEKRSPCWDK